MGLFIPKKIRVGFQKRSDTFTGKLAYVIYYDEKGKIRKEASFNSWCDASLGTLELDNTPRAGFVLNKGIARDGYWGSGRSLIRVHDERDFEFEISVPNLMSILMHSDVSKRDIVESCIYAWNGQDLVLLPCNSQEYLAAQEFTKNQDITLSAKDLVIGGTYKEKKSEYWSYIYMGYMAWDGPTKKHVFWEEHYKQASAKSIDSLMVVDDTCHPDYADYLMKTQKKQKTDVQALTPKLMVKGGVYQQEVYSYSVGSSRNKSFKSYVYMGQLCMQVISPDSSLSNFIPVEEDGFKKKHIFFDEASRTFVSKNVRDLIVNLNPSLHPDFANIEQHMQATCLSHPIAQARVLEPINVNTLDFTNPDKPVFAWVSWKVNGHLEDRLSRVQITKNTQGYLVSEVGYCFKHYSNPLSDTYYISWRNYGNNQSPRKQVNCLEDLSEMQIGNLYVYDTQGNKFKREELYQSMPKVLTP